MPTQDLISHFRDAIKETKDDKLIQKFDGDTFNLEGTEFKDIGSVDSTHPKARQVIALAQQFKNIDDKKISEIVEMFGKVGIKDDGFGTFVRTYIEGRIENYYSQEMFRSDMEISNFLRDPQNGKYTIKQAFAEIRKIQQTPSETKNPESSSSSFTTSSSSSLQASFISPSSSSSTSFQPTILHDSTTDPFLSVGPTSGPSSFPNTFFSPPLSPLNLGGDFEGTTPQFSFSPPSSPMGIGGSFSFGDRKDEKKIEKQPLGFEPFPSSLIGGYYPNNEQLRSPTTSTNLSLFDDWHGGTDQTGTFSSSAQQPQINGNHGLINSGLYSQMSPGTKSPFKYIVDSLSFKKAQNTVLLNLIQGGDTVRFIKRAFPDSGAFREADKEAQKAIQFAMDLEREFNKPSPSADEVDRILKGAGVSFGDDLNTTLIIKDYIQKQIGGTDRGPRRRVRVDSDSDTKFSDFKGTSTGSDGPSSGSSPYSIYDPSSSPMYSSPLLSGSSSSMSSSSSPVIPSDGKTPLSATPIISTPPLMKEADIKLHQEIKDFISSSQASALVPNIRDTFNNPDWFYAWRNAHPDGTFVKFKDNFDIIVRAEKPSFLSYMSAGMVGYGSAFKIKNLPTNLIERDQKAVGEAFRNLSLTTTNIPYLSQVHYNLTSMTSYANLPYSLANKFRDYTQWTPVVLRIIDKMHGAGGGSKFNIDQLDEKLQEITADTPLNQIFTLYKDVGFSPNDSKLEDSHALVYFNGALIIKLLNEEKANVSPEVWTSIDKARESGQTLLYKSTNTVNSLAATFKGCYDLTKSPAQVASALAVVGVFGGVNHTDAKNQENIIANPTFAAQIGANITKALNTTEYDETKLAPAIKAHVMAPEFLPVIWSSPIRGAKPTKDSGWEFKDDVGLTGILDALKDRETTLNGLTTILNNMGVEDKGDTLRQQFVLNFKSYIHGKDLRTVPEDIKNAMTGELTSPATVEFYDALLNNPANQDRNMEEIFTTLANRPQPILDLKNLPQVEDEDHPLAALIAANEAKIIARIHQLYANNPDEKKVEDAIQEARDILTSTTDRTRLRKMLNFIGIANTPDETLTPILDANLITKDKLFEEDSKQYDKDFKEQEAKQKAVGDNKTKRGDDLKNNFEIENPELKKQGVAGYKIQRSFETYAKNLDVKHTTKAVQSYMHHYKLWDKYVKEIDTLEKRLATVREKHGTVSVADPEVKREVESLSTAMGDLKRNLDTFNLALKHYDPSRIKPEAKINAQKLIDAGLSRVNSMMQLLDPLVEDLKDDKAERKIEGVDHKVVAKAERFYYYKPSSVDEKPIYNTKDLVTAGMKAWLTKPDEKEATLLSAPALLGTQRNPLHYEKKENDKVLGVPDEIAGVKTYSVVTRQKTRAVARLNLNIADVNKLRGLKRNYKNPLVSIPHLEKMAWAENFIKNLLTHKMKSPYIDISSPKWRQVDPEMSEALLIYCKHYNRDNPVNPVVIRCAKSNTVSDSQVDYYETLLQKKLDKINEKVDSTVLRLEDENVKQEKEESEPSEPSSSSFRPG